MNQLMDYSIKYLTPIFSKYHDKNNELTGKMTVTLTIEPEGKAVDVILSNHKLPKDCEDEIKKHTDNDWMDTWYSRRTKSLQ
jgi:hypothetical protein